MLIHTLQFLLPSTLTGWLVFNPPRNAAGYAIHLAATFLALTALALAGLWTVLPWWTPFVFGIVALAGAATRLLHRRSFASMLPTGAGSWMHATILAALASFALYVVLSALGGRVPREGALVDLALPFESGAFLVVNGGSTTLVNAHLKTLDPTIERFRAWRGQSYAVDLVRIDRFGFRARGLRPASPAAYFSYDVPVLAPCAGEVVAATDDLPDMQVPIPDRDHMSGNHVVLRCGGIDVVLGHFRRGSVRVTAGQRVETGERLAAIGNSGNTDEPHLHIHAQKPSTGAMPIAGDPVQLRLDKRFLVRNDRIAIATE